MSHVKRIMEVCGTHTQVIAKAGFSDLLKPGIKLISGPGCPVCVTPEGYIDGAIELLQQPDVMIATFGDLIRVKGSQKSLEDCMELKNRIKIVYSPFTALEIAECNPCMQIIFLAVGFETTAPVIAAAVKLSRTRGIRNLFFLVGLKLMPPVLKKVLSSKENKLDALICPGHVAAVMGADYFRFIPSMFEIPAAVCGFDHSDVAAALYYLSEEVSRSEKSFINLYSRCVRPQGNPEAKELMAEVFESKEGDWRGIGRIEASELTLQREYSFCDAVSCFQLSIKNTAASSACMCGEVITGRITPFQCNLFGKTCNVENPLGPCMVSSEGTCSIYYRYRRSSL